MRVGVALWPDSLACGWMGTDGRLAANSEPEPHDGRGSALSSSLRRALAAIPRGRRESAAVPTSIVFDASALLDLSVRPPTTLIRIAPRPPIDAQHEQEISPESTRVVHVRGGHTALGEELVPLDTEALRSLAATAAPGERFVITGAGSLVNAEHERRAGGILLEHAEPAGIEYGHAFPASSFTLREATALANSSLLAQAVSLGTNLALAGEDIAPDARLYVATNDGGCTPLARLSSTPVHSAISGRATELVGAAALCGSHDGRVIVADTHGEALGEFVSGVPTVVAGPSSAHGLDLAIRSAHVLPVSEEHVSGRVERPVMLTRDGIEPGLLGLESRVHLDEDLRAIGAACLPLTEWEERTLSVASAAEMNHEVANAEARVRARLVSFGAGLSEVRIHESRVIATAYELPRVVSVRIRGVASRTETA